MIIYYSRISRKTFTERKIRSERTSESRTKATRRRTEPSRGSARWASATTRRFSLPASLVVTRVGSPGELDLIPACLTYFDSRIFRIAVISDLRDHILLVSF
ncbi:hypothetical protein DY000_02024956 [Brassica cretica]|uniref:Uncharacterized protein n=1 Tax=Brassica cretica TaxID=69181 RepID=A0ABQ7E107_BRACR|nr:hypothetical protein DY000_02024956 [Brassica cretica]